MEVDLLIQNGQNIYHPSTEDGVQFDLERKGVPGKLTFSILSDDAVTFTEGNAVRLSVDGSDMFYGFIFSRKRDKNGLITVTAYDQLRYLKNKDTYVYNNKTAAEVIKMIADDFRLETGTIEESGFKIESRKENNKTLFDIILTALDLTLQSTGKLYVLYDDFGKLTLQNVENMKLNLLIDEETGENFDYTASIDGETYNKIKLAYENEETGKRDIYQTQDGSHMNEWGVLQYFETIDEKVNGKAKAEALLKLYNQKTRNLTISNAFGDTRVRAGSVVAVKLNFDDVVLQNYMLVEKVKHSFAENQHIMDLTLRGGEFIA